MVAAAGSARADTYPRQPGIDVLHYAFRLTLADDSDAIEGEATVAFRVLEDGVSAARPRPRAAVPRAGRARHDRRGRHRVGISPCGSSTRRTDCGSRSRAPAAPASGARSSSAITVLPAAGLLIGPNKHGDRTFFSDNWPDKARQWLPVVDHPYDKATSEFLVTAPAHYQVVSNGLLVEETDLGDGRRLSHWRQSVPIAPWLYMLGVARFAVSTVRPGRAFPSRPGSTRRTGTRASRPSPLPRSRPSTSSQPASAPTPTSGSRTSRRTASREGWRRRRPSSTATTP